MLTTTVAITTLLISIFSLVIILVLPIVIVVSWLRKPHLIERIRAIIQSLTQAPVAASAGMPTGGLPPLTKRYLLTGWEFRLNQFMARAVAYPGSWWTVGARWFCYLLATYFLVLLPMASDQVDVGYWLVLVVVFGTAITILQPKFSHILARLTLHFGRHIPYVLRPWFWLSRFMRERLDAVKFVTVRTIFLRRLFSVGWGREGFLPSYAVINWLTFLVLLYYLPPILGDGIEAGYAWGTYPFGTYEDIIVTQAYRNIKEQNSYSIHGYKIINGEKHEYYFELGPNVWFWELYPEFAFGQIPVFGRCTFHTYGILLRIPQKLKLFSAGSLYALNPWIVHPSCITPTIVPPAEKGT